MVNRIRTRIPVLLDGEVISFSGHCSAIINNISENGIYAKIPLSEREKKHLFELNDFFLRLLLPPCDLVNLNCTKKWSYQISPGSFIEHIGIEIINPPEQYKKYYKSLILQHFKWQ
jgi:hypothetical protein